MKKSLIALAVLTVSGAAFAQSTVTLFGGADLNYRTVTSGTNKFSGMAQDGIYSSRFGVNGVEDLGGGLSANFHFEGGMAPDVGTAAGFNFTRKSTIGLAGAFGEVRAGRDYTPLFTVHGIADPFGTNGVGSAGNMMFSTVTGDATPAATTAAAGLASTFRTGQTASKAGADAAAVLPTATVWADPNAVRANNSVTYYSPAFNGFSAAFMYSFGGENTNIAKDVGTATSLKLAYANGPLTVAYANQVTKGGLTGYAATAAGFKADTATTNVATTAIAAQTPTEDQKWTSNFAAASYDLGVAKLSAGYKTDKISSISKTIKATIVGVAAPMGALTLKATFIDKKLGSDKAGTQTAVGAVYDLSKRTSVYAAYSILSNEANFANTVGSAAASATTGVDSKGFEFGVKHSF
jgi:predicted porin